MKSLHFRGDLKDKPGVTSSSLLLSTWNSFKIHLNMKKSEIFSVSDWDCDWSFPLRFLAGSTRTCPKQQGALMRLAKWPTGSFVNNSCIIISLFLFIWDLNLMFKSSPDGKQFRSWGASRLCCELFVKMHHHSDVLHWLLKSKLDYCSLPEWKTEELGGCAAKTMTDLKSFSWDVTLRKVKPSWFTMSSIENELSVASFVFIFDILCRRQEMNRERKTGWQEHGR